MFQNLKICRFKLYCRLCISLSCRGFLYKWEATRYKISIIYVAGLFCLFFDGSSASSTDMIWRNVIHEWFVYRILIQTDIFHYSLRQPNQKRHEWWLLCFKLRLFNKVQEERVQIIQPISGRDGWYGPIYSRPSPLSRDNFTAPLHHPIALLLSVSYSSKKGRSMLCLCSFCYVTAIIAILSWTESDRQSFTNSEKSWCWWHWTLFNQSDSRTRDTLILKG